jgi:hypothetical protein
MKTTSNKLSSLPTHVLRPNCKAVFVPHEQYTPDSIKAMRHLVQEARKRNAKTHSYAAPKGYDGTELKPYVGRPDATDALILPSRTGNRLRYPDGRVTDMAGNPLQDARSKS